jgi:chemotaxis protein CheY-P-specific phosphatase CheC
MKNLQQEVFNIVSKHYSQMLTELDEVFVDCTIEGIEGMDIEDVEEFIDTEDIQLEITVQSGKFNCKLG